MARFDDRPPSVLVLGGGGLLGEAWITGVLAGYEDAMGADVRGCRRFVGTSAGSIVAASLVAGRSPRRPGSAKASAIRPVEGPGGATSPFSDVYRARRLTGACACAPSMPAMVAASCSAAGRRPRLRLGRRLRRPARSRRSSRRCAAVTGCTSTVVLGRQPTPMPRPRDVAIACCCSSRPPCSSVVRCARRPCLRSLLLLAGAVVVRVPPKKMG
jgi:hypothetical protein